MPEEALPQPESTVEEEAPEYPYARGLNEILEAVAQNLQHEKIVEAIAGWIYSKTREPDSDDKFRRRSFYVGTCFSALIFVGVGVMGYLKVIPADGTMGLLGALIGYWYGKAQKIERG
jgi:hypothetical protein